MSAIAIVLILVLCIGLVLGVVYDLVAILPTQRNGEIAAIAATVGMTLVFANGHQIIWGPDAEPFPPIIDGYVNVGSVQITWQSIIIWVVLAVVGVVLAFVLERTKLGRGMIASATRPACGHRPWASTCPVTARCPSRSLSASLRSPVCWSPRSPSQAAVDWVRRSP